MFAFMQTGTFMNIYYVFDARSNRSTVCSMLPTTDYTTWRSVIHNDTVIYTVMSFQSALALFYLWI